MKHRPFLHRDVQKGAFIITSRNLNERDTNRKLTTEYRAGKEIREKWT